VAKVLAVFLGNANLTTDGLLFVLIVNAHTLRGTMSLEALQGFNLEIVTEFPYRPLVLQEFLLNGCLITKFLPCGFVHTEDKGLMGIRVLILSLTKVTVDQFLKFHVVVR
jgi:hypothetical protein